MQTYVTCVSGLLPGWLGPSAAIGLGCFLCCLGKCGIYFGWYSRRWYHRDVCLVAGLCEACMSGQCPGLGQSRQRGMHACMHW
mmetsp:Transcript_23899/g.60864  ORF Transcript_23899/g.60864 Transcript_23899/m.60864 type:complete len:83 (+) Transcript_23899:824-1072(+)